MKQHETQILSAILSGIDLVEKISRLSFASANLSEEHFVDKDLRLMWKLLLKHNTLSPGGILTKKYVGEILDSYKVDISRKVLIEELFDSLASSPVQETDFVFSVNFLREERMKELVGDALTNALSIINGNEVVREGKIDYAGVGGALDYISTKAAHIKTISHVEDTSEGFIGDDVDDMLADYDRIAADPMAGVGIMSGIPLLDQATNGFQPGELVLFAGWAGSGKSQLLTSTAWHTCYIQKKNVFFATSETTRKQVNRRLAARHSLLPKFGFPQGLDSSKIKRGQLNDEEKGVYIDVLKDMKDCDEYGKMYVAQIPKGGSLSYVDTTLERVTKQFKVDLLGIDYLTLLRSDRPRSSRWEEFANILVDSKQMAVTYDKGNGLTLISPWQVNKVAYQSMLESGAFNLATLAETSEAERSADSIWGIVKYPEERDQMRIQCLKIRDDAMPDTFAVSTNFASSYVGPRSTIVENVEEDIFADWK